MKTIISKLSLYILIGIIIFFIRYYFFNQHNILDGIIKVGIVIVIFTVWDIYRHIKKNNKET